MKLALVYDMYDHKLRAQAWSQTYRDMLLALIERFDQTQHIGRSCSAQDIEADCVVFFDPHSAHVISIDGIERHKAVKYSYINDPHQHNVSGMYIDGYMYRKRGSRNRMERELERGVEHIICPYTEGYWAYLAPWLGKRAESMFLWFPVAPDARRFDRHIPLVARETAVLANGCTWPKRGPPYSFRRWAFEQSCVKFVDHFILNNDTPCGVGYAQFLQHYAGALALCDVYVVPKYLEIPLAGCVCFAQAQGDYSRMGFVHGRNCVIVGRENFAQLIGEFLRNPDKYQQLADAGRKQALNWTAERFADFIYNHAKERINGKST